MTASGWLLVFWLGLDPWGPPPLGMEHIMIGTYENHVKCEEVRNEIMNGWNANATHGPAPIAMSDCFPALIPASSWNQCRKAIAHGNRCWPVCGIGIPSIHDFIPHF